MSHILTVSRSSARDIAADFQVSPDRIEVIPLGVEPEVFQHYQDLEKGKWVTIVEWVGPDAAKRMIREGIERAKTGPR